MGMGNEESTEIWKDIVGYEDLYQVSSFGRVKSLNYGRTGKERILKACRDRGGYLMVCLCRYGKQLTRKVHRLVAEAFVEGYKEGLDVNHIDECKTNNHYSNLEWCTRKQNNNHGTHNKKISVANGKPVIQYDLEGNEIARFHGALEAERQTGVYNQNIWSCCNGKAKTAGGYIWQYE